MADVYATVSEFKDWLPVPLTDGIDDPTIAGDLAAASHGIDYYCNTHFWKTPVGTTRLFDTCDSQRLRINDAAAVTQVATDTDSDGVFETVWSAGDFQLLPLNPDAGPETLPYMQIWAIGALSFPMATRRQGLIRVTGTWGWAAVPDAVVQSTLLLTNRLLKRRGSPEGVAGFGDFGVVRITSQDDPEVVRYLTPYRTSRRAGGWAFA
jgi:hypothetical protein